MAGPITGDSSSKTVGEQPQQTQRFAFIAMTCLFFFWGFITVLNDILIPFLKDSFNLNYTQAMLVQFCFFGAYFIVSPFAGKTYRQGRLPARHCTRAFNHAARLCSILPFCTAQCVCTILVCFFCSSQWYYNTSGCS